MTTKLDFTKDKYHQEAIPVNDEILALRKFLIWWHHRRQKPLTCGDDKKQFNKRHSLESLSIIILWSDNVGM